MNFNLPRIYPITDQRVSGISHFNQAQRLFAGGAHIIQLREKYASPREFFVSAEHVMSLAASNGVATIINDRVDIALAVGADGVHLGQDDMPPAMARKVLGNQAIIGYSTHSVDQALAAVALPVDYIAIGPIFATATKENPDAVVGLTGLSEVRAAIGDFPLVAIGGIKEENVASVLAAGADSAAMISSLICDLGAIEEKMRRLNAL